MKLVILFALIALAAAVPVDEKKPVDDKPVEKPDDKAPVDEKKPEEKPEEKKEEKRKGLKWPLPEPDNEGDLMLHGAHLFDRVDELHKVEKLEKEEDKMVLSVGREYLRRVHEYVKEIKDFKIPSILCRDSERLNSTKRWEIRIRPANQRGWIEDASYALRCWGGLFCSTDAQPETQPAQGAQGKISKRENGATQSKDAKQNDPIVPSNSTHENATENANSTEIQAKPRKSFEDLNKEYYKVMGDHFARLLMKRYRKEKLEKEETEYLARWLNEESVHYGFMGIYCHDGENVEELIKRIRTFIEEKQ